MTPTDIPPTPSASPENEPIDSVARLVEYVSKGAVSIYRGHREADLPLEVSTVKKTPWSSTCSLAT